MWYDYSWKGDIDKSGGVLFNIGIHFFDVLMILIWALLTMFKYQIKSTGNT